MKLLSDAQLSAIQKVAMLGMQTDVTILPRSTNSGLELSDGVYGSSVSFPAASDGDNVTVKGMLYSVPTPVAEISAGQLVTVNTFRLWVPIDTDIRPGDNVAIGSNTYVVSDTTADQTWPPFLACSLRLAE